MSVSAFEVCPILASGCGRFAFCYRGGWFRFASRATFSLFFLCLFVRDSSNTRRTDNS